MSEPTAADLGAWANTAERGESFTYGRCSPMERPPTSVMAAARKLGDAGLVALVMRRERDGTVSWIAQRTWRRREA